MDREIGADVRRRRVMRQALTAIVAVAALAFFFAATVQWLRPSVRRSEVQIATVGRGPVEATLEANGVVVPLTEQVVSSPVEARVLRIGHRAGDRVRAGDEILTLDTAATRLEAARLGEIVAQKESESTRLRLSLDETVASLEAQLEQKKLDVEILRYTSEQKSKLRADGLASEQDALAAAAAAKKSDIELRQLGEAIARARRSATVQLAAAQTEVSIARRDRDESQRQVALAMLRADRDGVLTSVVSEPGATVRRGDILARIADLSSYRMTGSISDVHASRLAAGMRTRVHLDDAVIDGVIDSIDPRIDNGVMKFSVTLDQPSHPRLRNNLRVDIEIVTGRRANALVIPRGALARTDPNHAFVVRGNRAVRVPVTFGLAGDRTIEIVSGLEERDQVLISDMNEYRDVETLRLK